MSTAPLARRDRQHRRRASAGVIASSGNDRERRGGRQRRDDGERRGPRQRRDGGQRRRRRKRWNACSAQAFSAARPSSPGSATAAASHAWPASGCVNCVGCVGCVGLCGTEAEPWARSAAPRDAMADTPLRLSVLDQSPISEGSSGAQALQNTHRSGAAGRSARLSPLLGRRAPRRADARRTQPGGADRPDRRRDHAHPRGQRRGDAAPLQPVQGRRDLQPARRPVSRPHRPRARARRGHRPADHLRAAARSPQAAPDDFPQQLAELLGLSGRPAAAGPSVRAPGEDAARAPRAARAVAAGLLAAERAVGGGAGAAVRVRRLHQRRRSRDHGALPRAVRRTRTRRR